MKRYNPIRGLSLNMSAQDLLYLFQTPRSVYTGSLETLQLIPAEPLKDGFRYAKGFYIESPGKSSILTKYSGDPASNIPLLHPHYLRAVRNLGKESEFVSWCCSRLKFSTRLHLVDESGNITPEFEFLKNNATVDLLLLLRDHWDFYSDQLNATSKVELRLMHVKCTDGHARKLSGTVLPRERLRNEGPNLSFVDIPEPNDSRWLKFSCFGVHTDLSDTFYLRQLKALNTLSSRPDPSAISKSTVQAAYTGLESTIGMSPSAAR